MDLRRLTKCRRVAQLSSFSLVLASFALQAQESLNPKTMAKMNEVDPRYVSYNIETVEVTGGRFWKPFDAKPETTQGAANTSQPIGAGADVYRYRPPIDLGNPRLRKLASALSPAYVRVSGTWRNFTYFQDNDEPLMATPPTGFRGVMSRKQWQGVVDFSHAVGAGLVTSVATSAGTRDANGVWTPEQAQALFRYTKQIGGKIDATEFMNEPTFASVGGAPEHYSGADFGRDAKIFGDFLKKESPGTVYLGPGSIGEGIPMFPGAPPLKGLEMISTEDMLKASGPIFDAFSYHFYMSISRRCTSQMGADLGMKPEDELKQEWLQREMGAWKFYADLRDKYLPGKPMWLTEMGQAGCGGDRFASEFADSFRYVHQLGTLAQKGVKVTIQNTLASSDYGLLDEDTLEPRPNFWAALIWKRHMGTIVLDPGVTTNPKLAVYAHCARDAKGGVAMAILNLSDAETQMLSLPVNGERYTLSASSLISRTVSLNAKELKAGTDGSLPSLPSLPVKAGKVSFAPLTITFLVAPQAMNMACMSSTL
jgi:heparanase